MGLLINSDAQLLRNFFKEAAKLRGIQVKYQYPIDMTFSKYAEEDPRGYSEPQILDIMFEENPSIKTLKRYGWITETADDLPLMAHLPYDTFKLSKGCRINITSPLHEDGRLFVVTEIKTSLEYPEAWACKLAPVFNIKPNPQEIEEKIEKTNDNYLKVKL